MTEEKMIACKDNGFEKEPVHNIPNGKPIPIGYIQLNSIMDFLCFVSLFIGNYSCAFRMVP